MVLHCHDSNGFFLFRTPFSVTESDTDEENTEEIFENKLDMKIVDLSSDSLISTETEVASSIKSEYVEEEYSEFSTTYLYAQAKTEDFSHVEDNKMFQHSLLNHEMVQIYELPEEKPQVCRLSPEVGPAQSQPDQTKIVIRLWSKVILILY